MLNAHRLVQLGVLVAAVAANRVLDECLTGNKKYAMNVVLLEDNTYEWSRPFVQAAVERAIEEDRLENDRHGTDTKAMHTRAKRSMEEALICLFYGLKIGFKCNFVS